MTINLNYCFRARTATEATIRQGLTKAWHRAKDRPFEFVGELVDVAGEAASVEPNTLPQEQVSLGAVLASNQCAIRPIKAIGFHVYPGGGCGYAVVALGEFPGAAPGWAWDTYFSIVGGWGRQTVRTFQRHHRQVIELLEFTAEQIGAELLVDDPTGWFENRDANQLVEFMLSQPNHRD